MDVCLLLRLCVPQQFTDVPRSFPAIFQAPLLGLQAAMPSKDISSATSTFVLTRTVSGAVGISVGGAIYSTAGQRHLQTVAGAYKALGTAPGRSLLQIDVNAISDIAPVALKHQIEVRSGSMPFHLNRADLC